MIPRNPYTVLGIPKGASQKQIRLAYRSKAMETHPDRNHGSRDAFDEVQAAYDLLRNMDDEHLADTTLVAKPVATAFDSFFDAMDRHGRRPTPPAPASTGPRGELLVEISLEEAYAGGRRHVTRDGGMCARCKGHGRIKAQRPQPCIDCGGVGYVIAAQGFITVRNECASCAGTGRSSTCSCPDCAGQGKGDGLEVDIEIPEGCRDGYRLTPIGLRGVQVVIRVKEHAIFSREIVDLQTVLDIPLWDALLGTTLKLDGVDGEALDVIVPAGSWHGDNIRIEGRGMPAFSGRGDVIVELNVLPPRDDKEMRLLLQRMRSLGLQQPGFHS